MQINLVLKNLSYFRNISNLQIIYDTEEKKIHILIKQVIAHES